MSTINLTDPGAPDRGLLQRRQALHRANVVRERRAKLKRDLKAGRIHILPLLDDPPDWLATMKVADLLLTVPTVGRVKVNKWLTRCRISPSTTVGGLSDRQRGELIGMLRR